MKLQYNAKVEVSTGNFIMKVQWVGQQGFLYLDEGSRLVEFDLKSLKQNLVQKFERSAVTFDAMLQSQILVAVGL